MPQRRGFASLPDFFFFFFFLFQKMLLSRN